MHSPTRVPLLILGNRTFAEEVADLAAEVPGVEVLGFVENMDQERCRESLAGRPIVWVDDLQHTYGDCVAVCALSTTHRSRFVEQVANYGVRFATLIHPSARVSRASSVGEGAILSVGTVVAAHTTIGRHVIVNRGVLIGHHTRIGDFVTIGPGANVAGACEIGEAAYIGMGAIVVDHVKIGRHSLVSAGSLVTKDVPDHVQVFGSPARIIRRNFPGR